jgi:hypothetical protein
MGRQKVAQEPMADDEAQDPAVQEIIRRQRSFTAPFAVTPASVMPSPAHADPDAPSTIARSDAPLRFA